MSGEKLDKKGGAIGFDPSIGRYRGVDGRLFPFPGMTKLVCASCQKLWRGSGSPGRCPDCGKASFPISVLRERE